MAEFESDKNNLIIYQWQEKIKVANRNNIFCHCQNCNNDAC